MFDGENLGEMIYENTDWHAPSLLSFGEQPRRRGELDGSDLIGPWIKTCGV